jgi:DNA-binding transcriptional LysR family regulator
LFFYANLLKSHLGAARQLLPTKEQTMLDAHQLNIFLIAAELENFTNAAQHLNLSQPSVSAQIQSLERRLGTELFHRSGRHISLTEAGQVLLPLAREMVQLSIHIEETMASLSGTAVGHLKLGCSTAVGRYTLPRLIARFREEHPQVQVSCNVMTRDAALKALLDGILHLAVTSVREFSKEIEYHFFTTDQVVLIVPADHPWAVRGQIEPHELLTENFILREKTAGTRRALEEGLAQHSLHPDQLKTVMIMASSESIRTAVEEGIGVSFISRLVASAGIQLGRIVEVDVANLDLKQQLFIGHNVRRPATKAQAAFWEFIHSPANRALLNTL